MSWQGIRLYTDEDVDSDLAPQLRRRGYSALSCSEAGNANQELPDEWQLEYAIRNGRTILTHNIADYMKLDSQWKARGREHHGIIVVHKKGASIGELVRRSQLHLDTVAAKDQHNLLLYLAR